jgi:hypothetical protein
MWVLVLTGVVVEEWGSECLKLLMSSKIADVVWDLGVASSHSGSGKAMRILSSLEDRNLPVVGLEEK